MTARLLAIGGMSLVFIPLIPSLAWFFAPVFDSQAWYNLFQDPQLPKAFALTLSSSIGSTLLALILSLAIAIQLYLSPWWQRLQQKLPWLLSFPHAAFAIGLGFLIAPSGWLARIIAPLLSWDSPPQWITTQDPYAISLTIALALKESWFLLWILGSLLQQKQIQAQLTTAATLGYQRYQIWWSILLPQLLPRLSWALIAVLAYGLSVVDMAIILGPSTPPTLAVLAFQWLSEPDLALQAQGSLTAFLLIVSLLSIITVTWLAWKIYGSLKPSPQGQRWALPHKPWITTLVSLPFLIALLTFLLLVIWSFAGSWFFPDALPNQWSLRSWYRADFLPLWTSLSLACISIILALPLCLLWLETIPKRWNSLIYIPLILPALPIAAAQYWVSLHLYLDGGFIAVIWSHLAWVIPYMLLVLVAPYQQFDERFIVIAKALGQTHWQACFTVKWRLLMRPILAALSVGFAVSIAQYLPTLFVGAGKFATVTTEAVALSSGGNRRILAIQALLQALLPLCVFALSQWLAHLYTRRFQGLK